MSKSISDGQHGSPQCAKLLRGSSMIVQISIEDHFSVELIRIRCNLCVQASALLARNVEQRLQGCRLLTQERQVTY